MDGQRWPAFKQWHCGPALAFSDADIIRMATEDFVAVAGDDWYQRRRQDEVGKFWLSVADQGRPRDDSGTRQGIYCFTADGKLLASKNAGQNPAVMRDVLKNALEAFQRLPEEKRKPGVITVADVPQVDSGFVRPLPKGGLVLRLHAHPRPRRDRGGFCKGTCNVRAATRPRRDHVWLTEAEWKAAHSVKPKLFDQSRCRRNCRTDALHLIDNTAASAHVATTRRPFAS